LGVNRPEFGAGEKEKGYGREGGSEEMIGVKCPRCGLMQMPSPACKSCGASLGGPERDYGPPLPPPPPPLDRSAPPPAPGPLETAAEGTGRSRGFSKREAIQFGWITMWNNPGFFVVLMVLVGLVYILPGALQAMVREERPFLSAFLALASMVLHIVIAMGLIRISLQFACGEKGEFADLFACMPLFFKYFLAWILYALMVSAWWVVALLPGVIAIALSPDLYVSSGYLPGSLSLWVLGLVGWMIPFAILSLVWAIKYMFFGYFIVERGLGPVKALQQSNALTKGAKWDLFIFGLLLCGINLLGALVFLIGLFVTIPTTMVAIAYVYRRLQSQGS